MTKARLNLSEPELEVLAEALREALAGELLAAESIALARELLERVDAKLPSAVEQPPAGRRAGSSLVTRSYGRSRWARAATAMPR